MNHSAETPASVLYPTQYGTLMPGALQTFRDGALGNRRHSVPYGQSLAPFDNGVFGPALGNAAETPQPLHSYRDGLFNQGFPSLMPGSLTAFRTGLFSSPMGAVGTALDFSNPAVVLEWTTMMNWTWETTTPSVPTSAWDMTVSAQVLAAGEALLASLGSNSNLTIDAFVHAAPDGLYYPKTMLVVLGFGSAYNQECKAAGSDCPFPLLRDYYELCVPELNAINKGSSSDMSAAVAASNAACPIAYPAARATRVVRVAPVQPGEPLTQAQPGEPLAPQPGEPLAPQPDATVTEPAPATAPAAGVNKGLVIGGIVAAALLLGGGVYLFSRRKR